MRTRLLLSLALACSVGCQASLPNATKSSAKRTVAVADVQRLVDSNGVLTELTGKAHIISDNGLGIISNNSGAIISNNSGGIISDNGLGIISDNGLGYQVLANGPRKESLLADAKVEVLDAQGRLLVDASKKAIGGTTDKQGNFKFKGTLPAENLVLRIKLWNGGTLFAMLVYDETSSARTVDINTASTLGAQYVLDKFVQKRKDVYDRLPVSEADKLQAAMESARALLTGKAPTYKPADTLKLAEDLKTQDSALSQRLDTIEAILLAGQKNLGNGLPATQTALGNPTSVVGDGAGNLYIAEASSGRIRMVDAGGIIHAYAGDTGSETLGAVMAMVRGKDGSLYIAERLSNRVRKVAPDGTISLVAGTGASEQGPVDVKATATGIKRPGSLALGPDGTLYIGEVTKGDDGVCRLLSVGKDGIIHQIPTEGPEWNQAQLDGVAVADDGTLYAMMGFIGTLARKKPGGDWEYYAKGLTTTSLYARITLLPDGSVLVTDTDAAVIKKVSPTGQITTFAGNGAPGLSGDGGAATSAQLNVPVCTWLDDAGNLYIADSGNGLVRKVDAAGVITTIAGTQGLTQTGDALSIAINNPGAVVLDPQGRLVIGEVSSSTIKRLDGDKLTVIAGTVKGDDGDGGPATAAKIDTPAGIAYHGSDLYVLDASNVKIRKIDASGVITTVVGNGQRGPTSTVGFGGPSFPAMGAIIKRPFAIVIDPNGQPVWSDNENNVVLRLRKDGQVEVVAGSLMMEGGDGGDGGPATQAKLNKPAGLAYDSKGNLYIADTGNLVIRKIAPDGTISHVAGLALGDALGRVLGGKTDVTDGEDAATSLIVGPGALVCDAHDNLYVAEVGTSTLESLGGEGLAKGGLGGIPLSMIKAPPRVRKITTDGKIYTIAGVGGKALSDASGDNALKLPVGLVFDKQGRLVIADGGNNQIKMLPKGSF